MSTLLGVDTGTWRRIRRASAAAGLLLAATASCKRIDPPRLDAVRAFRRVARPTFQPPTDSLLTPAQLDLFLKIRGAARGMVRYGRSLSRPSEAAASNPANRVNAKISPRNTCGPRSALEGSR